MKSQEGLEVVDEEVRYVGYSSSHDEWKDKDDIEDPASGPIERFSCIMNLRL